MALTERDSISIAQLIVFLFSLFVAIWLAIRHGFGRNAGWFYLIILSLARIVGASLQLATISDPTNVSLQIGAVTLQSVGLSPLILTQLGLIGRALASIQKSTTAFITVNRLRLVQTLTLVGLILGIIGGTQAGQNVAKTGQYTVSSLSQAGIGLTIASFALLVLATLFVAQQISYVESGEKRLVLAVGLSLPFILVRLVYSAISVFGNNPSFNQLKGNADILLGMSVLMEMIVVIIVEGIGMTLKTVPKGERVASTSSSYQQNGRHDETSYEMGGYR
ncbi:uncharacterized protein F4822DRAFT_367992 [Hypoxylon trugodes]|uniref:uncharacterized protein n=1 Tax=Hypoxylon trugodes TaxID=326681 RepID=UPI0021951E0A|nr:uncharacterized protein F4822DRAFT_367992 [Hypoxylon trugodes]KAI1384613.1 hypothetical protein F4822DRAFT_367992 [Hypoxylon trugodes]